MANWIAAELQSLKDHFNRLFTRHTAETGAEVSLLRADLGLLKARVEALEAHHQ